jgi:hypothetical protein
MKRLIAIICVTTLLPSVALAQQQGSSAESRAAFAWTAESGQSARVALETRVTRGKPYTAEAITEFVQVLGDGNRIVRKNTARLFRDSDGRTRREEINEASGAEPSSIVITDPVAGTSLILDARTRTARKMPATFARVQGGAFTFSSASGQTATGAIGSAPAKVEVITVPSAEARRAAEVAQVAIAEASGTKTTFAVGAGGVMVASADRAESTKEDLGQQTIDGVTANGTRTTTVIPAGAIGNEQAITVISEQWFSPDLEMLVLTRHSDPRVGETTYRLTNITRSEPDRTLFQAPADYRVYEPPPMVWQRQQQQ